MKNMRAAASILSGALALSCFTAWAAPEPDSHAFFEEAAKELYEGVMAISPINYHYIEYYRDLSAAEDAAPLGAFSEENEELEMLLASVVEKLDQVSAKDLSAHERQVYYAMRDFIDQNFSSLSLPDYYPTLGPIGGILTDCDTLITEYYILNSGDAESCLKIIADVPRFLQDILLEIRYQESIGFAPTAYALTDLLKKRESYVTLKDHVYLEAFRANLEDSDLDEEQKAEYCSRLEKLLTDELFPAWNQFFDELAAMLPEAGECRGLCSYERGKEYYAGLLEAKTGTGMTPEETFDYLERCVEADMNALSKIYSLYPEESDAAFDLEVHPEMTDAREIADWFRDKTLDIFPVIDHTDYIISYLPKALQIDGNIAYYMSPPFDLLDRNVIRVNGSAVDDDSALLWTTLAHEGFPGHLYQTQFFMQNVLEYPVETLLGSIGVSEGWASYCEGLSLEWAEVNEYTAKVYTINDNISMAINGLLDIGVNYMGWDLKDMSRYLYDYYGAMDQEALQDFYNTLTSDPGIFLPYCVGYYQVRDIIDNLRDQNLSDGKVYETFLKYSNLPVWLIRKYLISDGGI